MVIVSKGIVEHVEAIKSAFATSGLIMGTPSTNFTISGGGVGVVGVGSSCSNNSINDDSSSGGGSIKSMQTQCSNRLNDLHETAARCILLCQPNSHPFQTRTLYLEPNIEVKVGRSIAKSRVSENNAIFDCKVLSRNHAVLWYSDGKFYVKDTKSSNGTFINERRISQSEPEELSSGDIVKFGVDVIENSRKEVHGCIIACVKLFTPDGREVKSTSQSTLLEGGITFDELHRLQHYMQETSQREKMLEIKLHDIQKVIEMTRRNASTCWQAMIDEDRLLNRIDVLENKLKFLQKNAVDDELKDEILKLQEDKCLYQNSAKEALRKVYQERMEAVQKLTAIERALCSSEDECSLLRDQLLRTQQNLQEVSARLTRFENECKEYRVNNEKVQNEVQKYDTETQELQIKLKERENELDNYKNQLSALLTEKKFLQRRLGSYETNDNATSDDETMSKNSDASSNRCTVKKWLENSDLNHREGSADIIKAICEGSDCYDEDSTDLDTLPELEKIQNKLQCVEKKLVQLNSYLSDDESNSKNTTDDDDDDSCSITTIVNDGNENIQEQPTQPTQQPQQQQQQHQQNKINYDGVLKSNTTLLMEICNEIFEYVTAVKSTKQFHKMKEDYKKLESKLFSTQEELNSIQSELTMRPTYSQLQEKINMNEYLELQLNLTYEKMNNLEKQITGLKDENESMQKQLNLTTSERNGYDSATATKSLSYLQNDNDVSKKMNSGIDIAVGTDDVEDADADARDTFESQSLSSLLAPAETTVTVITNDKLSTQPPSSSTLATILSSTPPSHTYHSSLSTATTTTTTTTNNHNNKHDDNDKNRNNDSNDIDNNDDGREFNEKTCKDEMDLINNAIIQNEEELIIFKEKYELILNENLLLKNSIKELKSNYENAHGRNLAKLFMYGTFIVILFSYFISLYNNSD